MVSPSQSLSGSIPVNITLNDQLKIAMIVDMVSAHISDFGTTVIRNLVMRVVPTPMSEFQVKTNNES